MSTKIEWCTETWNPIVGCSKISPGCDNCYAEKMAYRLAAMAIKNPVPETTGKYVKVIKGRKWDGTTVLDDVIMLKPFSLRKPRMIFVCSMGDLFHESIPLDSIAKIFAVIFLNQRHTFLLLTKRPERAKYVLGNEEFWFSYHKYCNSLHYQCIKPLEQELYFYEELKNEWPLKNIWIGVTAENQMRANERVPILLSIPAVKRFVSVEPMLTRIDLVNVYTYTPNTPGTRQLGYIDWVICGGESGPGARRMDPDWVKFLWAQCSAGSVPFFFKGWGGKTKNKAGSLIDGKEYKEYPKR